jgi:hypothetical protein
MVLYTEAYAGSVRERTLLNILLRHLTCQKVHRNFFSEPFGGPGVLPDTMQPTPEDTRPRGAARSARHPVTVEIVGSNPIGDASIARYANRKSGEAQTFATLWVRLPPVLLELGRVPRGCL